MKSTVAQLLDAIDPSSLDYQEWLSVGMAIRHEGGTADQWESWSLRDSKRYHAGECARKWNGFNGSANPVTAGTLVELAKRNGWRPERDDREPGHALDWDDVIGGKPLGIDPAWVGDRPVEAVAAAPWKQLQMYLSALFEATDHVGYVTQAWQQDDRWLPQKGIFNRTAGDIIAELEKYKDIGAALGDFNPEVGAWIRFNPLDGQGVFDSNVTSYRYALVESDSIPIEKQRGIYDELELPIAALVHSGKKSLHAIVRIGATSKEEYRERVNFLHKVCEASGLEIDKQNKNPSRLSRMPGVTRNGVEQSLVALNQGRESFEAWREWIEELNDSLPDIESLESVWQNLPPLAPPLIDGVLREGHKLLLSGPSKAGKSYLLLQLVIALAEGREWLGWPCKRGRVLYVNLELDRPSCLSRIRVLYEANGWKPEHLSNIEIWNLRGNAVPMDRLAPKLIRRAQKRGYVAVIIDPIYKVITGDENAADKMAFFCNQFDRVCSELGAAVIYCHHHSKGAQGQKSSRDRSSGSGVFARDPDAILDLIELQIEAEQRKVIENRIVCPVALEYLDEHAQRIGQDTAVVAAHLIPAALQIIPEGQHEAFRAVSDAAYTKARNVTGWRMEGTLREFAPMPPRQLFFEYPIHKADVDHVLDSAKAAGEEAPWAAAQREKKASQQERKLSEKESLIAAHSSLQSFDESEPVLIGDLAEAMGCSVATLKRRITKYKVLTLLDNNEVVTREQARTREVAAAVEKARDVLGNRKLWDVQQVLGVGDKQARRRLQEAGFQVVNGYVFGPDEPVEVPK